MENDKSLRFGSQLIVGILFVVVGGLTLLDNIDVIEVGSVWRFWPLIVVGIGVNKAVQAQNAHERRNGIWLAFVGCWLFISVFHLFGLSFATSWPLLIIGWGTGMVWKAASQHANSYAG